MSVSSAMYAAITGLDSMGTALSVISNNIANVNTVGFKASRAEFMDLLSQRYTSGAGSSQIGTGVRLGTVRQIFSQGSMKNSAQDTDIAISGDGFFKVRDPNNNALYYTRAGNFILDNGGSTVTTGSGQSSNQNSRMVTPTGEILQGVKFNTQTNSFSNSLSDITMPTGMQPGEVTAQATYVLNLNAADTSKTPDRLSDSWDGSQANPIDPSKYTYQTSQRIYDSLGTAHDLSIYFDPDRSVENKWDYIVCCAPSEDARTIDGLPDDGQPYPTSNAFRDSPLAGILQRGTITFEPSDPTTGNGGTIREITADDLVTGVPINSMVNNIGAPANQANWPAAVTIETQGTYNGTTAGNITFTQTYPAPAGSVYQVGAAAYKTGDPVGTYAPQFQWAAPDGTTGTVDITQNNTWITVAEGVQIRLNDTAAPTPFPAVAPAAYFDATVTPIWVPQTPGTTSGLFSFNAAFKPTLDPNWNPNTIPPANAPTNQTMSINLGAKYQGLDVTNHPIWQSDNLATTQFSSSSYAIFQTQDGFPPGQLQSIAIDRDGIISGTYSNGRIQKEYQINLTIFPNQWGLAKHGNNLYRETLDSGGAIDGQPNIGRRGAISPNALEQSNVDLANEFVDMIVQERGFQANSKVITTTDSMMAELINLKR